MRRTLLFFVVVASPLTAQNAPALFDSTRATPLSPGQWSYSPNPSGSEARFGALFSMRCDRASRRVTLRGIEPVTTEMSSMTIGTDLGVRTIAGDGVVAANDAVLDAIAFSRGRFIVSGAGFRLILPADPEAARSIEDCRN